MPVNYYEQILGAITNIEDAKDSIASAIEAKGVNVPVDASLGDYAALIADISTGQGGGSSDSSTKYGITCGAMYTEYDNAGYFNTGYIPGPDTIIRFAGSIVMNGTITHGCGDPNTSSDVNVFRIFGFEGENKQVFCDRRGDGGEGYRLVANIEDTYSDWEFGNNYIANSEGILIQDSSLDSSWSTDLPICIFGGANDEWYCGEGGDCAWFEILEPSTNDDGRELKHRYVAANDASGNIVWYDEVSQIFIYPTSGFHGSAYPNYDPYIYELNGTSGGDDSSSGDSSSNGSLSISYNDNGDGTLSVTYTLTSDAYDTIIITAYSENDWFNQKDADEQAQGESFDYDTWNEAYKENATSVGVCTATGNPNEYSYTGTYYAEFNSNTAAADNIIIEAYATNYEIIDPSVGVTDTVTVYNNNM